MTNEEIKKEILHRGSGGGNILLGGNVDGGGHLVLIGSGDDGDIVGGAVQIPHAAAQQGHGAQGSTGACQHLFLLSLRGHILCSALK